ncbi:MAG: succinyl-CoA synthetase subunit alpha, partial [Acidimicrobiales bacterium]
MIVKSGDRVLVQGITGKQGTFWTEKMQAYGTNIVGGVDQKKEGTHHLGGPVFASAAEVAAELVDGGRAGVDVSVMFIPPAGARAATE